MFVGLISRNLIAPMMIAEDLRGIFVGDWEILVLDLLHLREAIHWKEHPRYVYAFSLAIEG
jgi:hypothetical protein